MPKYPLVRVEWRDSYGVGASWQEIDDFLEAPSLSCFSVGWLVLETKECLVIVPHLSEQGHAHAKEQGCGDMTIPKEAVVKIKRINR